jgi:hypothetical protein
LQSETKRGVEPPMSLTDRKVIISHR